MAIDPPALAAQGGEIIGQNESKQLGEAALSHFIFCSTPFLKEVSKHPCLGWQAMQPHHQAMSHLVLECGVRICSQFSFLAATNWGK